MNKKRWGRRVGTSICWAVLCFSTVYLQPRLQLDNALVTLLLEKATWIAGLLIVGLSGTDVMRDYTNNRKVNGISED